jgi:hypothetical protein
MGSATLQCPECGADLFEADADGLFYEDTEATCQECGTICRVTVEGDSDLDEEHPGYAGVTTDESVEDIGQPACNGSCGAVGEFVGTPCLWNCERAAAWKEAVLRAASIPPASPLRGVGYWQEPGEPALPTPQEWVNTDWDVGQRAAVIRYLDDGKPRNAYMGSSLCRFCGCVNGSTDLTDGVWVWPEGYAHYLTAHGVVPPQAFVDHVLGKKEKK